MLLKLDNHPPQNHSRPKGPSKNEVGVYTEHGVPRMTRPVLDSVDCLHGARNDEEKYFLVPQVGIKRRFCNAHSDGMVAPDRWPDR